MRAWWIAVVLAGCAEQAPPDLLYELTGTWSGSMIEASLRTSDVVLEIGPRADGYGGFAWADEPDELRRYTLLDSVSVEDYGIALDFQQDAGVRRLVISALTPFEPMQASWNATWDCEEAPDQECQQLASLQTERW